MNISEMGLSTRSVRRLVLCVLLCGMTGQGSAGTSAVRAFESSFDALIQQGKARTARALAEDAVRQGESVGDFALAGAARLALAQRPANGTMDGGERARAAAQTLAKDTSHASQVRLSIARAFEVSQAGGPLKESMAHALRAVEISQQHDSPDDLLRALALAWEISIASGNLAMAEQYGRQAVELKGVAADSLRRLQLQLDYALSLKMLGRRDDSLKLTQETLRIAEASGDLDTQAVAHFRLSTYAQSPADALVEQQKQIAIVSTFEDQWRLAVALMDLSSQQIRAERFQDALGSADRALATLDLLPGPVGSKDYRAATLFNKGIALNRMGSRDEGLRLVDLALKDFPAVGPDAAEEFALAGRHREAYERLSSYLEWKANRAVDGNAVGKAINDATAERMARVEAEARLAQANQRMTRGLAAAGSAVAAALVLGLVFRQRLLRRHAGHLAELNIQLETLAQTDALTGLHNRHHFMAQIGRRVAAVDRSHDSKASGERRTQLTFFIIDLDHFKKVNDTFGHAAGDAVLKQAGVRLAALVRSEDELVRWGGEEFLLMTAGATSSSVQALAERIRASIAGTPFDIGSGLLSVTCSIGFASYPSMAGGEGLPDWQGVVELADQALYQTKNAGRNGWTGITELRKAVTLVRPDTLAHGVQDESIVIAQSETLVSKV